MGILAMRIKMNSSLHFTLGILAMKNEMNSYPHFTLGILAMKNEMISGLHFILYYGDGKEELFLSAFHFTFGAIFPLMKTVFCFKILLPFDSC
jgi:hypothetical protein